MQVVYKVHKLLGSAVAGGGRVVAGHLVAPGTVKGMLGNAHQLHMRIAHILHVVSQLMRQIAVI